MAARTAKHFGGAAQVTKKIMQKCDIQRACDVLEYFLNYKDNQNVKREGAVREGGGGVAVINQQRDAASRHSDGGADGTTKS